MEGIYNYLWDNVKEEGIVKMIMKMKNDMDVADMKERILLLEELFINLPDSKMIRYNTDFNGVSNKGLKVLLSLCNDEKLLTKLIMNKRHYYPKNEDELLERWINDREKYFEFKKRYN